MRDRPNRSDHYQYRIAEVSCTDAMMTSFTNDQSIGHLLNPFQHNEEYLALKEELKKEFWKLAERICTDRQLVIMKMLKDGYTQMEMAEALNVNQSSITKSLNGNIDYKGHKKVYGGLIKKMKKHCKENPKINEILERMMELQDEKW